MNIDKAIQECIKLQHILAKLGQVERADYYPLTLPHHQSPQHETDIEHSYFLAMLSWQLAEELTLNLSQEKILKLALVHDLPEVYVGDTPLFSSTEFKSKQTEKEMASLENLKKDIQHFDDLHVTLQDFYTKSSPEARFVGAVDRLVALIVHINSEQTQFIDKGIGQKDIDDALPWWRKRIEEFPELIPFTDSLLKIWFNTVKLA